MSRLGVFVAALAFAGVAGSASAATPAPPALYGWVSSSSLTACYNTGATPPVNALAGVNNVAVTSVGGTTYAVTVGYWSGQLSMIDLTNQQSPVLVGCTPPQTSMVAATNITISGTLAYVTAKNRNLSCAPGPPPACQAGNNDDGSGNALTIVDISNPAAPAVVGAFHDTTDLFGAYAAQLMPSGGHTYAVVASQGLLPLPQPQGPLTGTGSLTVVDVTTPSAPMLASTFQNPNSGPNANWLNHATGVALYSSGGHTYAYVTAFNAQRLSVFDVTTPTSAPVPVGSVQDATNLSHPNDVVIQGHYAYVVNQVNTNVPQLAIYDLSNPTSPQLVGTVNNASLVGAYRIRIFNNIAYIAATQAQAVAMVDVSDPTSPIYLGELVSTHHLNSASAVAVDPTSAGVFAVGVQPLDQGQQNPLYPPYPLQTGGPPNTGVVTLVQVDPSPVAVSLSSTPSSSTPNPSASFAFSASDQVVTFQCSLDGGTPTPCGSGTAQYSNLSGGNHTFTVTAADAGGTQASSSYTWTVTPPQNTAPPTITGIIAAGSTLTGNEGTWTGSPTFSDQWLQCDAAGQNCSPVPGATSTTTTIHKSQGGSTLEFQVTATTSVGSTVATSAPTPVIPGGSGGGGGGGGTAVPAVLTGPVISGQAVQGATLTLSTGTWSGSPKLSVSWQRCDASGNNCASIANQTAATYTVAAADVGSHLRAVIHASNSAGSVNVSTPFTPVIAWSKISGITATLAGSKGAAPNLLVAVPSLGSGIDLQKLTVSLPKGLKFAALARVQQGLVLTASNASYAVTLSHGVLTLALHSGVSGPVSLTLASGTLSKRFRAFARQLKSKHGLTLKVTLYYAGLPTRHVSVSLKLK